MADIVSSTRTEREFHIGAALRGAAIAVAQNALPFCIVSGIATLPGLIVSDDATVGAMAWVWGAVGVVVALASGQAPQALLWPSAGVVAGMVLGALSQAIVIQGTLAHMRGRPVQLLVSSRAALRVFFPVIGAGILVAVFSAIGLFFFIVPAFVMLTMLYVAVPVCVVEQASPWKSLRRSADLVSGNGWNIFGMVIVVAILEAIGGGLAQALDGRAGASVAMAANLSWGALDSAFSAALLATTYHELRVVKDGIDTEGITEVFD